LDVADRVADRAEEVARQASLAGRLLHIGTDAERSWAGKWLPRLGASPLDDLARSRWGGAIIRGGRVLGVVGNVATFVADYAESASDPENTTAEALIHAGGVTAGGAVGGAVAVAVFCGSTAGLGCLALAIIGGGYVGGEFGGFMADVLTADSAPCPSPRWVPVSPARN